MWLLDTHLLVRAAYDPARLPKGVAKLIESRDERLVFSLASMWEVAIKAPLKRLELKRPDFTAAPDELQRGLIDEGFAELPIAPAHISRIVTLPWLHRDPFDRMLVAQAAVEGLTLLTANAALKRCGRFVRAVQLGARGLTSAPCGWRRRGGSPRR
ncbi:MAG TPA: type II toxin-antitoxin system VapC family toxin [Rubrivivax sp.]|nr:type II toxin-antitoxin system VapC family toxin [Rubrivivax sp.]